MSDVSWMLRLIASIALPLASLAVLVVGLLRRRDRPAWLLWCSAAVSMSALAILLVLFGIDSGDILATPMIVWFTLCLLVLGLALGRRRRGERSGPLELTGLIMPFVALALWAGLMVYALAGGLEIESREASSKTLGPTQAELTQPGRANRLVGTWVYLGSFMVADDNYDSFASGSGPTCTFRADGHCNYEEANRWEVDHDGRLHLWSSSSSLFVAWAEFFFRNGKLYLEGDSQWQVYRRQ